MAYDKYAENQQTGKVGLEICRNMMIIYMCLILESVSYSFLAHLASLLVFCLVVISHL